MVSILFMTQYDSIQVRSAWGLDLVYAVIRVFVSESCGSQHACSRNPYFAERGEQSNSAPVRFSGALYLVKATEVKISVEKGLFYEMDCLTASYPIFGESDNSEIIASSRKAM